jgi:cell division protein FtsB
MPQENNQLSRPPQPTQQPQNAPQIQQSNDNKKDKKSKKDKPKGTLKYKFIIFLLIFIILGLLIGAGVGGYQLYDNNQEKEEQIEDLENEINELESQIDLDVSDLQEEIRELESQNNELKEQNTRLESDLSRAREEVASLKPKNIEDFDYTDQIQKPESAKWQDPIYTDLTGNGKNEGVFSYRIDGPGDFLNVYVYSYLTNDEPTQILRAEEYPEGQVSINRSTVRISSVSGPPDNKEETTTTFAWDEDSNSMRRISGETPPTPTDR